MKFERIQKLGNLNIYKNKTEGENVVKSSLKFDMGSWRTQNKLGDGEDMERNPDNILDKEHLDYIGKKMEFHFNLGTVQLPDTGETLAVRGKTPMFIPYGLMPEQDLSIENIKKCQEMCNLLAENLGICSKDSKYFHKVQHAGVPIICAITCPEIKVEDMSSYIVIMFSFLILDDIFDNSKDFWTAELSTSEILTVVDTFSSIVLGETTRNSIKDMPTIPKFMPVCKLLLVLREKVLALDRPLNESKHFFDAFTKYMAACAWETQGWTQKGVNKKSYHYYREMTVGFMPCIEVICLLKNIQLSPKIRRDPLLQSLNRQMARHISFANDIFSLKKEIDNGETMNIILFRNKKKSVDQSLAKTLQDLADCVENIEDMMEQLVKKFPDDHILMEYFMVCKIWMDAHVQWMFLNQRYGNNDFEVGLYL